MGKKPQELSEIIAERLTDIAFSQDRFAFVRSGKVRTFVLEKQGTWEWDSGWFCSECSFHVPTVTGYTYCPHCRSKNRVDYEGVTVFEL